MKANPRTILDALEEVLHAANHVSEDEWIHWKVLGRVLADLADVADTEISDTELIYASLATAYKALGVTDPYEKEKARLNKMLLSLEEQLRVMIAQSATPLQAALRASLGASCFDFRTIKRDTLLPAIEAMLGEGLPHDESELLANTLNRAASVMYFVGQAGELVTDKFVIEYLAAKADVTVVVRSAPILTEATIDDCLMVGLDKIQRVSIMDTGMPMLGVWLERTSKELRERFDSADLVISKGAYNCATLLGEDREMYFITPARDKKLREYFGVEAEQGVIGRFHGVSATAMEKE